MKTKRLVRRQGDVIIFKVEKLPEELPAKEDDGVLAYGEVTGHAHRLDNTAKFEKFGKAEAAKQYLKVIEGGLTITHEEHAPIILPDGDYEIVKQREYNIVERVARPVLD